MVMYRGTVVEQGPSDQVILNPAHPYTQALATAAPSPGIPREELAAARRARTEARGLRAAENREIPAAGACPFIARCPYARPVCSGAPSAFPVGESSGHTARCWMLSGQYTRD
jgi:peptide/nickel transport system ATP-binding protein